MARAALLCARHVGMPQGISTASGASRETGYMAWCRRLLARAVGVAGVVGGRQQWLPLGGKWGNWRRSEGIPFSLYDLVYFQKFCHVCILCLFFF